MSPAQVGVLAQGKAKWVTQRPKPYTNCMFASVCVPLSFMGYDLPADFVERMRDASGVPRDKATSTADTRRALKVLIPDCPIEFGGLDDDVMLRRIADGEIVVRVMLHVGKLPLGHPVRKHFKPTYTGGHAVALGAADPDPAGGFDVLWMDPMGRPVNNYDGIKVAYSVIKPAMMRTPSGKVRVTVGRRDAALPEQAEEVNRGRAGMFAGNPIGMPAADPGGAGDPIILTRGKPDEFAFVPKGTSFLHPITKALVTRANDAADFRLAGRSTDGKFAGVWVNTRRIEGSRGQTLLIVDRELIGVPFIKPG